MCIHPTLLLSQARSVCFLCPRPPKPAMTPNPIRKAAQRWKVSPMRTELAKAHLSMNLDKTEKCCWYQIFRLITEAFDFSVCQFITVHLVIFNTFSRWQRVCWDRQLLSHDLYLSRRSVDHRGARGFCPRPPRFLLRCCWQQMEPPCLAGSKILTRSGLLSFSGLAFPSGGSAECLLCELLTLVSRKTRHHFQITQGLFCPAPLLPFPSKYRFPFAIPLLVQRHLAEFNSVLKCEVLECI